MKCQGLFFAEKEKKEISHAGGKNSIGGNLYSCMKEKGQNNC